MNTSDIKLIICPRSRGGHYGNGVLAVQDYSYEGQSHSGLAISALNTAKVLRNHGVDAQVKAVKSRDEIQGIINQIHPTHVAINALWLSEEDTRILVEGNPYVEFTMICHSNIAFLQGEPNGISILRKLIDLEQITVGGFHVAGNSRSFVRGVQEAWEAPTVYLPNLYYLDETARPYRPPFNGGTLRIGAFGAQRPLKNPTSSAFAALAIATNLNTNLEFYVNTGRTDGWGDKMIQAVRAIYQGLPYAKLVEVPWTDWASFRRTVRHMHLLLQPSFTETFNLVTADGVAEGIASVTSDAIEWVPDHWKASSSDVQSIARTGRCLLTDEYAGRDGIAALTDHNEDGIRAWKKYLERR